jgi:hypothetical protein
VITPTGLPGNPDALIREAARLRFGELSVTAEYPVSRIPASAGGAVPAVPAIALPLQRKAEFECPPEHLSVLTSNLPEVTKCLIIGWRGSEPHFTSLLRTGPKGAVQWLVVAGPTGGDEVIQNLQHLPGVFADSKVGFSDLIITRKTYDFFSA